MPLTYDPSADYGEWIEDEIHRRWRWMLSAVRRNEGGCLEPFTAAIEEAVKNDDFLLQASEWLACEDREEREILGRGLVLLLEELAQKALDLKLLEEAEEAYERRKEDW